jgi:hypothetical protein
LFCEVRKDSGAVSTEQNNYEPIMTKTPEQLDEIISRVKNHADVSSFQKDPANSGSVNLVSILSNIPKARIEKPNLLRVRNKILDRISLPSDTSSDRAAMGFSLLRAMPRFLRITGGIVGAFTIALGLTLGTAVAALESLPGQPIYPVKKIVENVQLQLATSEEEKTNLQIKFANNRVDELETILQRKKEGKASEAQVQKVVASTSKDLEKTSRTVTDQSKDQPNINLLAKIVTLSNKQAAVIQAAQVESEGQTKVELEKALESTKVSKEQAIENIEKAGLVVEDNLLIMTGPDDKDTVSAEGKLTAATATSISVGTSQFMLTKDTEYVNIKSVDLKAGVAVKITGEVRDKKTYAVKIEVQATEPKDSTPTDSTEDPVKEEDKTVPIVPPATQH